MSTKRVFDITLPDDIDVGVVPEKKQKKRGPMASAVAENAGALQERKSAAEAIRDENNALAHEYVALRDAGHVVAQVPLDAVKTSMLVRDRLTAADDAELEELVTSIRDIGLSNPIRVVAGPDGAYELVQGFRRLTAYRQLHAADPTGGWDQIPALVVTDAPDIGGLYRRMVDENVVRKDLSFAEMAHAVRVYAGSPDTDAADVTAAVAALFQSAPYSKRSYIRSFAYLLTVLEDVLAHPTAIPRALGVSLARGLKEDAKALEALRTDLGSGAERSAAEELDVLRRHAGIKAEAGEEAAPSKPARTKGKSRSKTTFHLQSAAGQVKCTAAIGRLEIRVDRDFTSIERQRLEAAISALVEGLE
ncbi:MAG: ParB N-terminal domain-containing protein [Pseudomonadota bacterium]